MIAKQFGILTFESTHHAIEGEKLFKSIGLDFKTIPTPREITSSCGLSIKFYLKDINKIKEIINKNKLAIKGIYKFWKENGRNHIEKICC
ncbi:DUF3343 domain-containing protein [Anaerosalibacter massiliensis]|uniref:DUF3343 domain-containing protein n=1 Tax=Anaerosalibacter massiliensis TaxID=1347392 RepID=A0A9X2S5B3_9FIRM|nr:DUF3343 domain-containing protein [Anaerosalibacter massiliensis]MCR2044383.1 DUF3343 domain-containing protein [Anaerosalibacter massiliensis]